MGKSNRGQFYVHGDLEIWWEKCIARVYFDHKCAQCGTRLAWTWKRTNPVPAVLDHFFQFGRGTRWICRRKVRGTLQSWCLFRVTQSFKRSQIGGLLLQEHRETIASWMTVESTSQKKR
jgi:hypothetical protein